MKRNNQERDAIDLGTVRVSTLFRRLFVPTLLGMLSISAVTVADGMFVGHGVGSDGIAAINIYVPLLMLAQGVGLMAGVGSSVVASIHLARGKVRAARLNVTQALWFVTLLTLLLVGAVMLWPDATARMLGGCCRSCAITCSGSRPGCSSRCGRPWGSSSSASTAHRAWRCGARSSRPC